MRKVGSLLLTLVLIFSILCNPMSIRSAGKNISEKKIVLYTGQKKTLKNGNLNGKKVVWKATKKKIVKIYKNGKIEGDKKGKTTVYAKYKGKTYKWKVTVKKTHFQEKDIVLKVGETKQLKLIGTKIKSCKSMNGNVASVTKKGKVEALSVGKTQIKVTGKNGRKYKCEVTVITKEEETGNTVPTQEQKTTGQAVTTQKAATTEKPATTQKVTTTEKLTTTQKVATIEKPATTQKAATTEKPATTQKVATTEKPATTQKVATTEKPATTQKAATTEKPATTQKVTTTEKLTTTQKVATTEKTTTTQQPATTQQEKEPEKNSIEEFKQEIRKMVLTADLSKHDVLRYNLKYQQMDKAWNELLASDVEVKIANQCYGTMFLSTEKNDQEILTTVRIYNCDVNDTSENIMRRYTETKKKINEMLAFVKAHPEMSEMDKVLYVHDYVASHSSYQDTGYISHMAGGILGDNLGVCEGYANTLRLVLPMIGIETKLLSSNPMVHAWNYVKVDGEWYHVDLCWDDKISGIGHTYFIRNDSQFGTDIPRKHYDWFYGSYNDPQTIKSTSTKYDNWFVHDINSKMIYDDGYWYYRKNNYVMKAKLDGSYNEKYKEIDNTENFDLEEFLTEDKKLMEECRKEIRTMLLTADFSKHDFSKYHLTNPQLTKIWEELRESDDDVDIISSCYGTMFFDTEVTDKYVITTARIYDCDRESKKAVTSETILKRYEETKRKLNEMLAFVKNHSKMTEMDKILYAHEYIAEQAAYLDTGMIAHEAGGILGENLGVCEGYAEAMSLILKRMKIDVKVMQSGSMNHAWNYVKADGEWYHVDLCWDDKPSTIGHTYFIRNDQQFNTDIPRKHYNWRYGIFDEPQTIKSTSTKYDDWFVHDVVGKMVYENDYWYYRKDNYVMKAKLDGSYNEKYKEITNESDFKLEDYIN